MNEIILILQIVLFICLGILLKWLQALPAAIHKQQEQLFQQKLSKELEMLKISQSQIQLRKIDKFTDFAKIQTEILTNANFKKQLERGDSKALDKLNATILELGIGFFFFASDSVVKRYVEWKEYSASPESDPLHVLKGMGELMLVLRKDIGYSETELDYEDYLKMFITDWDATKLSAT